MPDPVPDFTPEHRQRLVQLVESPYAPLSPEAREAIVAVLDAIGLLKADLASMRSTAELWQHKCIENNCRVGELEAERKKLLADARHLKVKLHRAQQVEAGR